MIIGMIESFAALPSSLHGAYNSSHPTSREDNFMATPVVTPPPKKYPAMVEKSIAKESQDRSEKIPHMEAYLRGIRESSRGLQIRYDSGESDLTEWDFRKRMIGYDQAYDQANAQKRALVLAESAKDATKDIYIRSSNTVYDSAFKVESKSGKNRLYLGNKEEVAGFAAASDNRVQKKKRILNAGVWSWDVNFAWLEGGIHARTCFKLKSELPDSVKNAIRRASNNRISTITHTQFKDLCEKSEPAPGKTYSDLWHSGEKRLSWYALEIITLLENAYRFRWDTKDDGVTRFYLEKRT
jgi:hypothetical protein